MGILTLYGTKKLLKKNSPAYMGILTLYGAKKSYGKFPHDFHKHSWNISFHR
jgi:hypothetical protein